MKPMNNMEQERRAAISAATRNIIRHTLDIIGEDDDSLMLCYCGFYLQISFSPLHPLLVIYLAKQLDHQMQKDDWVALNNINQGSILGSHMINTSVGCYSYRATYWLDAELTEQRFLEILDRCVSEANHGILKFFT